jgi:RsiW-degrading membrane proteinase PrsW (M82 family)
MLESMLDFFKSFFYYPGLTWYQALIGIGLAFAFGAAWFAAYRSSILKKPWAWAVLAVSAVLTLLAVTFVQIPLQVWSQQAMVHFWGYTTFVDWVLLTGIPIIALSGLVQEGAKLVPVVFYWWRKGRNITPRMGLVLGAVAGLGFGVFEAVWVHNSAFVYGWDWSLVESGGIMGLATFWERFFLVGFHIAASALAGYGLAKGWGWKFYLIAAGLHTLVNYVAALFSAGLLGAVGMEIYVVVISLAVAALALWLRWRRTAEPSLSQSSGAESA